MNDKILLKFIALPALSGSLLASSILAGIPFKADAASSQINQDSCSLPASNLKSRNIQSLLHQKASLLIASSSGALPDEEFSTDFSAEESDAAVALFGCDCPACMNVFQQIRRQALTPKGEGHCLKNLARLSSPEKVKEVLKALDAEEAKNKL